MSKKYVASDEITIVDPGTQIARTYEGHSNYATYGGWNTTINSQSSNISKGSTYKMAGSGSGYLTTSANHIVRLYDVWTSNLKITISFATPDPDDYCGKENSATHNSENNHEFDHVSGSMSSKNASYLTGWTLPKCSFTIYQMKWKQKSGKWTTSNVTGGISELWAKYTHKFLYWTIQGTGTSYSEGQSLQMDENILTPSSSSLSIVFIPVFAEKASA